MRNKFKHKGLLFTTLLLSLILAGCDPLPTSSESVIHSEEVSSSEVLESSSVPTTIASSVAPPSSESIITSEQGAGLPYEERLYLNSLHWGLGHNIEKYVSNNRDYDWYVDQWHTGEYWYENCGPSSTEMVGRYHREDFAATASDLRDLYRSGGGWWYGSDITQALALFDVEYTTISIVFPRDLIKVLDAGNVVLVNPSMEYINMQQADYHHTGLFYTPGTGHFIVCKGYVVVDGNTFFEFYDPWSIGESYVDGTLKGIDRYYDEKSFMESIRKWYVGGIVVNKAENNNIE